MSKNIIHMYGSVSYVDVHDNDVVSINVGKSMVNVVECNEVNAEAVESEGTEAVVCKVAEGREAMAHFGLEKGRLAHWVDVYSRLTSAGMIRAGETSKANFTWIMCGEGTAPREPIRWHGTTRELAYIIRRYLNSRWEVASRCFKDKKGSALPKNLKSTSAPSGNSAQKMDSIFLAR